MVLNVMLRPMAGSETFIRVFTDTAVTVLVRNIKMNLEEGSYERRVDEDGVSVVSDI